MRTTTKQIANALRKGVEANFEPKNQAAELEKLSELLLDMAASLEMDSIVEHTGLAAPGKKMEYSNLLGEIGWELDDEVVDEATPETEESTA
jgi:hypothetical protein